MAATRTADTTLEQAVRAHALSLPEAEEHFPWGEPAARVRGKNFAFLGGDRGPETLLAMTVKLPIAGPMALELPYVTPAGYNLGRSGWVTVRLGPQDDYDLDMLKDWVTQSYIAVAPKALGRTVAAAAASA
ncbi:MAG: MmcQ/YjbR family DNA-binding protein [Maricaulaceae bacterium]